jgi:GT2 family glycosyltransferase
MGGFPLGGARSDGLVILAMTPYALDLNLGASYNAAMALLPNDDDWAVMLDHDILLTTREWYRQIAEAIAFKPAAGAFVAVTNRIDAVWQRAVETDPNNHDVGYHTAIGLDRLKRRTLLDITDTKGFGGVLFAVSKAAWRDAGGFADGLLCVDHSLHFGLRKAGRRVYLLENCYVYHRRRAFIGDLPADTPRAKHCPCRGPEPTPTIRIALPERLAS